MASVCFYFCISCELRSASAATGINDLTNPQVESAVYVNTARVILKDRDLIERDFPQTKALSDSQLNDFLLNRAAYLSLPQAAQRETNTPVSTNPNLIVLAYRPEYYGRALVFQTPEGPLIDVKGSGSLEPKPHDDYKFHQNGLISLGESIREFIWQKAVQKIFDAEGGKYSTVGCYAVIDWGFDVLDRGRVLPAGAVLREGHSRHPKASRYAVDKRGQKISSKNHFLKKDLAYEIEMLLRKYGVSTTIPSDTVQNPDGSERMIIDVQGTKENRVVDFGSFHFKERFNFDSYWYPERKVMDADPLIPRNSSQVVAPLPKNIWGATESGIEDPVFDNSRIWSERLAADLRSGIAHSEHAKNHFELFFRSLNLANNNAISCEFVF